MYAWPGNPYLPALLELAAGILNRPIPQAQDNFFELGGGREQASRLLEDIQAVFGVGLPAETLEPPHSFAEAADLIQAAQAHAGPAVSSIPHTSRDQPILLAPTQEHIWFMQLLDPRGSAYNISKALRLHGSLDESALRKTLNRIAERHEPLRTTIQVLNDRPVQVIEPASDVPLTITDLTHLPEAAGEAAALQLAEDEARQPYDLEHGPLWRISLLRLSDVRHILAMHFHHIIADAWGLGIFLRELQACYSAYIQGAEPRLPELAVQYADIAAWQRTRLSGPASEQQLSFWRNKLEGVPFLDLPTDFPRPRQQTFTGARLIRPLSEALYRQLEVFSQGHGVTLFITLLAAFYALLRRYTAQDDIAVGAPVANRTHPASQGLVGALINSLVLRADLSGDPTFSGLLQAVRQVVFEAFDHQELPFARLVAELQPKRDLSRTPLFQVMFNLIDVQIDHFTLGILEAEPLELEIGSAQFDLSLNISTSPLARFISLEYNTDLFEPATAERMLDHYLNLLQGLFAKPEQNISKLPILSEVERKRLLVDWNSTIDPAIGSYLNQTIDALFEAQVERTPDALAVVFHKEQLTYRELNQRANQLARFLRKRGVGPDVIVGLLMERSVDMLVGIMGILKAGGAYLPLDPVYPMDRLSFICRDANVSILLTQNRLRTGLCINGFCDEVESDGVLPGASPEVICLDNDWDKISQSSEQVINADGFGEVPQHNPDLGVQRNRPSNLAYVMYTSGSTGRPKGVLIEHLSAINLWLGLNQVIYSRLNQEHREPLRVSLNAPFIFDASVQEWLMLLSGHALVIIPSDVRQDADRLLAYIRESQIDVLDCIPSQLKMLISAGMLDGKGWAPRAVLVGGEAIDPPTWNLMAGAPHIEFYNLYGPTECTVDSTICKISSQLTRPSIGRPIGNVQAYVLDRNVQPTPVGAPGELYIGGRGVGRGYLNLPKLTSEYFIPNPFWNFQQRSGLDITKNDRIYKTGDLAFYRPDGSIKFLGRMDFQVKLRGYRIELGEIESALVEHPAVQQAVVIAREDTPGEKYLAAYLVVDPHQELSPIDIRSYLHKRLPEYMLPSAFTILDSLPLTPNRKVDRRNLPRPERAAFSTTLGEDAPRNPFEEMLASIWRSVLGIERVGIFDNFFELGGHSLMATQLASRVRTAMQVELPIRVVFEEPTIAGLALAIEKLRQSQPISLPPILSVNRDQPLPLALAQERMWFLHQMDPQQAAYNISGAVRFSGTLDLPAMREALQRIVDRHESLRTTFHTVDGQPVQKIHPAGEITFNIVEMTHMPESEAEKQAYQVIETEARQPYDLENGPLCRITVIRLAETTHVLAVHFHHIITDAWGLEVFFREFQAAYNAFEQGLEPALPELALQYADYAAWQRVWLSGPAADPQMAYWRSKLDGATALDLPTDHLRPRQQTYRGASIVQKMPPTLYLKLERLSQQLGGTQFMTLLAAFYTLLQRYTGQDDFAIGVPIANRNYQESEKLIGTFVNTLVLRADLSGDPTFTELFGRVRQAALEAFDHQDLPFAKLVAELQPERDTSRTPLFQVMFNVVNVPAEQVQLGNLEFEPIILERGAAQFDLTLSFVDHPIQRQVVLEYNTDLFEPSTAERMLDHWFTLLDGIILSPDKHLSELPLLSQEELFRLLKDWNGAYIPLSDRRSIAELFEEQAQRTPDAPAFFFQGVGIQYQELNARANQVAHALQEIGVEPRTIVGLCAERSIETMAAVLGILKAGCAYLPLDPHYPAERLAFMLQDSGVQVVLVQQDLEQVLPENIARLIILAPQLYQSQPSDNRQYQQPLDSLLYVLYTSGSTGLPKGVMGTQVGALNRFQWMWHAFPFQSGEVCALKTSLNFVDSVWECFGPLLQGVPALILPTDEVQDVHLLVKALADHGVTRLVLVPSLLRTLLEAYPDLAFQLPKLKMVVSSGETLPAELAQRFRRAMPHARLLNLYGSSEAAADVTCYDTADLEEHLACLPAGSGVPIGRPIDNTRIYILDTHLNPVPIGAPGEIYAAGNGLAAGYLNRPQLTKERFLLEPFVAGARMFKTGDLGRYLPDGTLIYLGRNDRQVKIRGMRVEPGEIEALLAQQVGVKDVSVVAWESEADNQPYLSAYVVKQPGAELGRDELRSTLQFTLPDFMIPAHFIFLDALPLMPNGKVDQRSLPKPVPASYTETKIAPRDTLEQILLQAWQKTLGVQSLSIYDDFFALGGHSLLGIRLFTEIENSLGLRLPAALLFEAPSVAELARVLRLRGGENFWKILAPIQPHGKRPPFFCVHGFGGGVVGYEPLSRLLDGDQPFFGLQALGLDGLHPPQATVEDMAGSYLEVVRLRQPHGPYFLGGYCLGGVVAFEMARQLENQGEEIAILAIFEGYAPGLLKTRRSLRSGVQFLGNIPFWLRDFIRLEADERFTVIKRKFRLVAARLISRLEISPRTRVMDILGNDYEYIPPHEQQVLEAHIMASLHYQPKPISAKVDLFRVRRLSLLRGADPLMGWGQLTKAGVQIHVLPGIHQRILQQPFVQTLAEELGKCLA